MRIRQVRVNITTRQQGKKKNLEFCFGTCKLSVVWFLSILIFFFEGKINISVKTVMPAAD